MSLYNLIIHHNKPTEEKNNVLILIKSSVRWIGKQVRKQIIRILITGIELMPQLLLMQFVRSLYQFLSWYD